MVKRGGLYFVFAAKRAKGSPLCSGCNPASAVRADSYPINRESLSSLQPRLDERPSSLPDLRTQAELRQQCRRIACVVNLVREQGLLISLRSTPPTRQARDQQVTLAGWLSKMAVVGHGDTHFHPKREGESALRKADLARSHPAYRSHARGAENPVFYLALLRIPTFRASVIRAFTFGRSRRN
jgi:hypothetical protein